MAEESKYGFKDKSKALETIELLKSKELAYQKLTVRGLLGRAKRVLTLTKAEEKINNIKSAMGVFEDWLKDHESSSSKSSSKSSAKPESDKGKEKDKNDDGQKEKVPGLGFKDLAAAENTIKALEGRDPKYQKLAVEGLVKSAKRVLPSTGNADKQKSIKEAMKYLEKWLEKFDKDNKAAENMDYLEIDLMNSLMEKCEFSPEDKLVREFLSTYEKEAKGNYKVLRTMYPKKNSEFKETSWDIIRNKKLTEIKEATKDSDLFDEDSSDLPTKEHLKLIMWAFSPAAQKLKNEAKKGKRSHEDDNQSAKKKRK